MIAIRYPLVLRRTSREQILDLVDRLAGLQRELTWLRERG
jgi:hypothetical protein